MRASFLLSLLAPASFALNKHVAIVTGGTRGIGKGIAEALASQSFDLLLTYNSDADAAAATAAEITEAYGCAVECVGGDVSQPATRDAIFAKFDEAFKATHALGAVVHNAGQYVGVTSSNADGIGPSARRRRRFRETRSNGSFVGRPSSASATARCSARTARRT